MNDATPPPRRLHTPDVLYRGYRLICVRRGWWVCQHETHGMEVSALENNVAAVVVWPCKGQVMRAIDRTFGEPGHEQP